MSDGRRVAQKLAASWHMAQWPLRIRAPHVKRHTAIPYREEQDRPRQQEHGRRGDDDVRAVDQRRRSGRHQTPYWKQSQPDHERSAGRDPKCERHAGLAQTQYDERDEFESQTKSIEEEVEQDEPGEAES